MSPRRSPPLHRAAAVRTLVATAAIALGGCSEAPSGVHVIVTMSDADYDAAHAFDHLTVTAHVGAKTAAACLYPEDAVVKAEFIDEDAGATECADRRTQPWTGLPTAESWAFAKHERTINVEAKEGEDVEIGVIGGLGGRLGTVSGSGTTPASSAFPELRVELRAGGLLFPKGCEGVRLEPSVSGEISLCDADENQCPDQEVVIKNQQLRSRAVICFEGSPVSRVQSGSGLTCQGPEGAPIVWCSGGNAVVGGECTRVSAKGRFVRCKEGDARDPGCTLTTDCKPPRTLAGVRPESGGASDWDLVDVSCLPPMGVPISWSLQLPRPFDPVFGVAQGEEAAEPTSCFLELFAIGTQIGPCDGP